MPTLYAEILSLRVLPQIPRDFSFLDSASAIKLEFPFYVPSFIVKFYSNSAQIDFFSKEICENRVTLEENCRYYGKLMVSRILGHS